MDGKHVSICKVKFMNVHGLQKSRGKIDHIISIESSGDVVSRKDGRGISKQIE